MIQVGECVVVQEVMAHAAFRCQAYTRALMYLESYLSSNPSAVQSNLQFLQVSLDYRIFKVLLLLPWREMIHVNFSFIFLSIKNNFLNDMEQLILTASYYSQLLHFSTLQS